MAIKLRGVSVSSLKGKDFGKKIMTSIRSLYESIVRSFAKLKEYVSGLGKKGKEPETDIGDARPLTGLGYEPVSVGATAIYVSISSDDDIFDEGPVFNRITTVPETEAESGRDEPILVSAHTTKFQGLPVEPLEDSSDVSSSDSLSPIYTVGIAQAKTSSDSSVEPAPQAAVSVVKEPLPTMDIKVESASQDSSGIMIVPGLRRMAADVKPSCPVCKPTVLQDESDMVFITIPELMIDVDDAFVGNDVADMPDDGIEAVFVELVVKKATVDDAPAVIEGPIIAPTVVKEPVVIETVASESVLIEGPIIAPTVVKEPIVVDVTNEAPIVFEPVSIEPLVEGEYESGIIVFMPFEASDVDTIDGPVVMDPFASPEVFDEAYVDARHPMPKVVPEVIIDDEIVPTISEEKPTVSFSFGMSSDVKDSVVRFMF